jgi:hypothetical protein
LVARPGLPVFTVGDGDHVAAVHKQVSALARAVSAGRMMHRDGKRGLADEKPAQCGWRYFISVTGIVFD